MKKQAPGNNRRRKKTVAQQKAAYPRWIADVFWPDSHAAFLSERAKVGDEKKFLVDALLPFHATIVEALTPHFQDVFAGDPLDELEHDEVPFAVDLIENIEDAPDGDPLAAAIHDVYRDGAEAGLPHVKRAIQWNAAFEAKLDEAFAHQSVKGGVVLDREHLDVPPD